MTKENAKKIGATNTSSLKGKESDLAISGFPECKQRQDCLLGVEETYDLKFGKFVASEQKYQVLDSGDADVVFGFTTDGDLAGGKYVTLDDDKKFFPPYNITFAIRNEALKNIGPEGREGHRGGPEAAHREGDAGAQRPRRHRQEEARRGREPAISSRPASSSSAAHSPARRLAGRG